MKFIVSCIILLVVHIQFVSAQFISEQNSGVSTQLNSSSNCKINPFYPFSGWACGINGTVIKTIGSTNQWRNVSGNGIPANVNLINICGLDSGTALVTGFLNANTWVWKTSNNGQNWIEVFNQPNGRINAVWMKNYIQGFMEGNPVGGRWSLWKTTNGGNNWDSSGLYLLQAGSEVGWPNSFCMRMGFYLPQDDSNKIWFGTNNYRIYYSSNYGQSWNIQQIVQEQNILSIAVDGPNPPLTLFAGGSNNLFKSTDYGINWSRDSVGGTGSITGITYCAWSFYLSRENKIYWNYPGPWAQCYTAAAGMYNYLDNRGSGGWFDHYAVRSNGGITFLAEGEGVQKISSEIPDNFSLHQNYPNPFNPVTTIKFAVPLSKGRERGLSVRIIIYDVLGREVAALVNEQLKPGTYEVEFDGMNYPSGVYFYKLIAGYFTETRKMVMIK